MSDHPDAPALPVTSTQTRDEADAKAWFYLDHRGDIEAWAALRTEGRSLFEKHLIGVAAELDEVAEQVGAERESSDLDSGSWPTAGMFRPTWATGGGVDVDVVVQWERSRLLTPGSNEWPYVGVRVRTDLEDDDRRRRIAESLGQFRPQFTGRSSRNFPCWDYVRPSSDPIDPDAYVVDLLTSFSRLWGLVSPVIDGLEE